ncbi:hypothetical protein ZWY2020_018060 [Hordeum vulgare]|nr:hypothetical protein ZWY2020_018060 [Hordeum vulgare]
MDTGKDPPRHRRLRKASDLRTTAAYPPPKRPTILYYGVVPRLRHVSLNFLQTGDDGEDDSSGSNRTYRLSKFFLGEPPQLEYLVLQLRGRQMWIELTTIPD